MTVVDVTEKHKDLVDQLLAAVSESNPDADLELLRRAYVFSTFEHKGQVRHSGEPYMVHPLEALDLGRAPRRE